MISKLLIILSNGKICYSKTFRGYNPVNDIVISKFITSFDEFAEDIGGGIIKSIHFKENNFIYSYDDEKSCIFILITDINDPENEARSKIKLLKSEFIKRYYNNLKKGGFKARKLAKFDIFIQQEIVIPPRILLLGEDGVGKSSIMNFFPGETIIKLNGNMNEIVQKSIALSNFNGINEFLLIEINLKSLIDDMKAFKTLLNSINIICIVTNSGASNINRTKIFFSNLKQKVINADYYIIANFQDLLSLSYSPEEVENLFGVKTFGFSAIQESAKEKIYLIFKEMLEISIIKK